MVLTFLMQHITFPSLRRVIALALLTCISTILFAITLSSCIDTSLTDSTMSAKIMAENRFFEKPVLPEKLLVADPGVLLLLVPDGQVPGNPEVTAWIDAASEEGVRLKPVTDKQFMGMGSYALKFAGLILPDQLHTVATDELLKAVLAYTTSGGNTMLVYDFGSLVLNPDQSPVYSIPKSRLSGLAGVDYVLYDALRDKSTVNGPITAMRSTMRALQVPPGKSVAYVPGTASGSLASLAASTPKAGNKATAKAASVYNPESAPLLDGLQQATAPADVLDTYSGYLLGNLTYSSYVTQGAFDGKTLSASPQGGLAAGVSKFGRGQVLFVNLPLTYLKVVRTDALLMHGYLHYFAQNMLQMARLSSVPNGVAGLTLNWHLDSFTAQQPTLTLEKIGIFDEGPFSIDMTAGPDAVAIGDETGWDLDNNPVARDILRRFSAKGHAIGSHGGWNHDHFGINANETNRSTFLPYLEKNASAIQRALNVAPIPVLGLKKSTFSNEASNIQRVSLKTKVGTEKVYGPPLREYSAPNGNNPMWAMDWLEQQGIVGVYFGGHTGLGPTRQYREGQLRNPGLWVFPVTPGGQYATFEEFETRKVPKQEIINWYHDLVNFTVDHNTTRLIYAHPNGANVWTDVLQNLLAYAKSQGNDKFKWYTMTRLADFMTTRQEVVWSERRDDNGGTQFELLHPTTLNEMVWLLPKTRYTNLPVSTDGSVKVSDRGTHWALMAGNTRRASFNVARHIGIF